MFFPPWQVKPTTFAVLYIGNTAIKLPRLRTGDSKSVKLRNRVSRDTVVLQKSWPRERVLNVEFGGYLRNSKAPRSNMAYEFMRVIHAYPGMPAQLVLANKHRYYGVIRVPRVIEINDCQYNIGFELDVFREIFPSGEMRLEA